MLEPKNDPSPNPSGKQLLPLNYGRSQASATAARVLGGLSVVASSITLACICVAFMDRNDLFPFLCIFAMVVGFPSFICAATFGLIGLKKSRQSDDPAAKLPPLIGLVSVACLVLICIAAVAFDAYNRASQNNAFIQGEIGRIAEAASH